MISVCLITGIDISALIAIVQDEFERTEFGVDRPR
jgi:hypothetical protein